MSSSPRSSLLSVEELPTWLVHRTRQVGLFSAGRLKILLIALVCIILGFVMTSSFGPAEAMQDTESFIDPYGSTSGDILEGPGFGASISAKKVKPEGGNVGSYGEEVDPYRDRKPSVSGALYDLHHAVSGKFSSWASWKGPLPAGSTEQGPKTVGEASGKNATNSSYVEETVLEADRDTLGERTRVGKCTIIFYGASIYERAVRTHEAHDRLHGYPLHVLRHQMMDDVWSKPAYILSLLLRELARPETERLQWLLWVDADTVLLNPYIPIETFLPPEPEFDDVHLLISHDWNGLNNGVFPVRVNQWAVDLFSAIVSYRYYRPEASLVFRDQSAMDTLLKEKKFADHVVEAPQRWFNAYQGEHNETLSPFQVRRGDFLVHFAGVIDRDNRMTYWLERAEEHAPDWEMEIQHTTYPAEVRDFWRQLRASRSSLQQAMVDTRQKSNELMLQTDQQLTEYQDRLIQSETGAIVAAQDALRQLLEHPDSEISALEEAMTKITMASAPLDAAKQNAHKILLKEAHETIFAAEKDLLEQADKPSSTLDVVTEKASILKQLVLQPDWHKAELNLAIEELRQARARLVADPSDPAVQKQKELEAQLEAQRKIVAEAEQAKAAILEPAAPPAAVVPEAPPAAVVPEIPAPAVAVLEVLPPAAAAPVPANLDGLTVVTSVVQGDTVTHTHVEGGGFMVTHTVPAQSTVWNVVIETQVVAPKPIG